MEFSVEPYSTKIDNKKVFMDIRFVFTLAH